MAARRHLILCSGALVLLCQCAGDPRIVGSDQPISIIGGGFHSGELPGLPPETEDEQGPTVTAVEIANGIVQQGQQDRLIAGRTTDDALSIAVRFADLGSGYWITPVGGPEPLVPGELGFELRADFHEIEPGTQQLRFVAVDENGNAGVQRDLPVCVTPDVPDNLNACDATRKPPAAVISLVWDRDVDLDLIVTSPTGQTIDAQHPTGGSESPIPDEELNDPTVPKLDTDSNAGCVIDGRRRENLVFEELSTPGNWLVYTNLFEACGEASVGYRLEIYRRQTAADGTYSLELADSRSGNFIADQANGGATAPLYLTAVPLP